MLGKPWYQQVAIALAASLAGFLLLGATLDSITNATALISPGLTYFGSATLASLAVIGHVVLRHYPLRWVVQGQHVRLPGLGRRAIFGLAGAVVLLWTPRFAESLRAPHYEAWMEVSPNPVVRGAPASLQFYFNNDSDHRITLKRMTTVLSCAGTSERGEVGKDGPGWKSSLVQAKSHKHNFYGAEHAAFPYSCGLPADQVVTIQYAFQLFLDDGSAAERVVSFQKTLHAFPTR